MRRAPASTCGARPTPTGAPPGTGQRQALALARNRARLGLATVRGLLLDLLATGDRAGVDTAMEEFLRLYYGSE
ncbi:hypothetical protein SFUMM280S_09642 [Streptomyces fumanus]